MTGSSELREIGRRIYTALIPYRFIINVGIDSAAWTVAIVAGVSFRYDLQPSRPELSRMLLMVPVAVLLQFALGCLHGLYVGRWTYGSFEEVAALVKTSASVGALILLIDIGTRWVPLTATGVASVSALVLMAGSRYSWRLLEESRKRPLASTNRVLVFGAGEAGHQIVTSLLRDPASRYLPVALIDDDPRKQQLRVRGVPVRGTCRDLAEVAAEHRADTLLVAVPSADAALLRELSSKGADAGLSVLVLPPVSELFDGLVAERDIRPPTMADLLGRREIDTDLHAIAGYLSGKRVLVTGAGGSIGSELCRQVHRFGPAELIMLDRDESALHAVQLSLTGRALLDTPDLVVCDIRDAERVDELFDERRPQVVFHAAALKHLALLERHPAEAWKTNVLGTLNLLDAAVRHGVVRFVNLSTDKAANPISVLGCTKRITERLTAGADAAGGGTYLSVRFGNVLGSRGSVLTTFEEQIKAGGPVTVTDAEVTRYFMTVEEAVQLTIQAGAIGRGREVLVLDMGEPVRILDVANLLVEQASRKVQIVFTGLRPGEKLHEDLFGDGEAGARPIHPLISHVEVSPLSGGLARNVASSGQCSEMIDELQVLCRAQLTDDEAHVVGD